MAAYAFHNDVPAIDSIRLDTKVAEADGNHAFLLEAVRSMTGSQVAVVYHYGKEAAELKASAVRSTVETRVKDASVTVGAAMSRWIESLEQPIVGARGDCGYFEKFPEAFQYRLRNMAVLPLRTSDGLRGLLTLGRIGETAFDPAAVAAGEGAARLLTAVLERDSLRQKLVERKVVERAKGILQERGRLTEEQAYLSLRSDCTRRRITMAELAKEVIEQHNARQTQRGLRPNALQAS